MSLYVANGISLTTKLTTVRPMEVSIKLMDDPLYIFRGQMLYFPKNSSLLQSLKIEFVLTNSADPNEMSHYATFRLGLHCLPKYLFRGFWSANMMYLKFNTFSFY